MAVSFLLGAININQQNTNGGISVGENQQFGWSAHRKTDNGIGQQVGVFLNSANLTIINDTDVNDGNIADQDIMPAAQGQAI